MQATATTDPVVADALDALPQLKDRLHFLGPRDQVFARDLIDYAHRKKFLTKGQAPYVRILLQRAGVNEQPTEPEKAVSIGDVSGIKALFDRAACHLKAPGVVMQLEGVGLIKVHVGKANSRRYAGKTVVEDYDKLWPQAQTYGIINAQGGFEPKKDTKIPEHLIVTLQAFAADPVTHAAAFGKLTGRCCFCRLPLTDPRSTVQGYGPDCAENFGLPWGERPAEGSVFSESDTVTDKGAPDLTGFVTPTGNESKPDSDDPHPGRVLRQMASKVFR